MACWESSPTPPETKVTSPWFCGCSKDWATAGRAAGNRRSDRTTKRAAILVIGCTPLPKPAPLGSRSELRVAYRRHEVLKTPCVAYRPANPRHRRLLLHRRKRCRRQNLAAQAGHDRTVGLGLGALLQPFRIGHECAPLFLALGEGLPDEQILQSLI